MRRKPVNDSGTPQHTVEAIAHRIWPDLQASFSSEGAQRMFEEWETQQEAENTKRNDRVKMKGPGLHRQERCSPGLFVLLRSLF